MFRYIIMSIISSHPCCQTVREAGRSGDGALRLHPHASGALTRNISFSAEESFSGQSMKQGQAAGSNQDD